MPIPVPPGPRPDRRRRAAFALVATVAATGCSNNPFRPAPVAMTPVGTNTTLALPTATAPTFPPLPSFVDNDPKQLEQQLARSRQETQLAKDELAALREQLAATSTQLSQARAAARPPSPDVGVAMPAIGASSMEEGMTHLAIPGATARMDGGVVRIELPADKLFEPGTASLLPSGAALLSQAASEVQRTFTGQFVGIEGHTDTEPLQNATWGSPHQFTLARASAVFEFLTARTALDKGQVFVVAHGPNHPVVSNATSAGRTRNRRIELVVYPDRAGVADGGGDGMTNPGGGG